MICMGDQSLESAKMLSSAIFKAAEQLKRNIAIVKVLHFDHYEQSDVAREKDVQLHDAMAARQRQVQQPVALA